MVVLSALGWRAPKMEILADIADLVTHVAWLPKAELQRKDDCTVLVFTGLELYEKLFGNGGLGVYSFVRWATIDQKEVPVRSWIALLLAFTPSGPELRGVEVLAATIEDHEEVGVRDLTVDAGNVLHLVEGLVWIVEHELGRVVSHAAVAGIVDDKESFSTTLRAVHEHSLAASHRGCDGSEVGVLVAMNIELIEPKLLESFLDSNEIFLDFFDVRETTEVFFLTK